MADLPTSERLARELDDRVFRDLAARARLGEFCELRSPHVDPHAVLLEELLFRGDIRLAKRLVSGEFNATFAEMDRWLTTDQGRRTVQTLHLPGDRP